MSADLMVKNVAERIEGPLLFLRRNVNVGLNTAVEVIGGGGKARIGRITTLDNDSMIVEVLESTSGLGLRNNRVRIFDQPLRCAVGPGLLGRSFNGVGQPIDGGPPIPGTHWLSIDGLAINPAARDRPKEFIETGISSIDVMNSLVRGQKLPLFSSGGLPHDRMITEIAQRARLRTATRGDFAVVFVAIGVSHDSVETFRSAMENSGALDHTVLYLNLADDPSPQRLLTPRFALTAAEYLAFVEGRHVLVIMTDMTNYCEALREVSASHGEIPGRKGYPGYLYSDLATIFERAGCVRGLPGTLTQLPVLTMPGDDIGHPIPDLTGYITEGQLVLDRELDRRGIYPPVKILPSLSRLMDAGIGKDYTHEDHPALAHQLFAAYARTAKARVLASVMGEEGLPPTDQKYLRFGDAFEDEFIQQPVARTLEESMAIGWHLLRGLPASELSRLGRRQISQYIEGDADD
jgi:V/A-type H+-transporting ATPase subunit B